jgi:DNA-binding transcriptional regulator YiaG
MAQIQLSSYAKTEDFNLCGLEASFEQIASFSKMWDILDDQGRASLLRVIVKRITATREKIQIEVFLDSQPVSVPSRTDIRSGQNYYQHEVERKVYHVERVLSPAAYTKDYARNAVTFGEALRKARMDAGLQIRELAAEIGVSEDSVINWEIRGMKPRGWRMKELVERFPVVRSTPLDAFP